MLRETDVVKESESDKVIRWRIESLTAVGYTEELARMIAERPDIDLHYALWLIEQGCSPGVATEILT